MKEITMVFMSISAWPFSGEDIKNKKGKATNGDSDIDMADENKENSGDDSGPSCSNGAKSKCECHNSGITVTYFLSTLNRCNVGITVLALVKYEVFITISL